MFNISYCLATPCGTVQCGNHHNHIISDLLSSKSNLQVPLAEFEKPSDLLAIYGTCPLVLSLPCTLYALESAHAIPIDLHREYLHSYCSHEQHLWSTELIVFLIVCHTFWLQFYACFLILLFPHVLDCLLLDLLSKLDSSQLVSDYSIQFEYSFKFLVII